MSQSILPTIDANPERAAEQELPPEQTQEGDIEPFDHRFRRLQMRAQLFGGDAADVRLGRYRVERRLGAGAMGSVYLGLDEGLERNVAIKVLRRENEVHRARIEVEAKALAKLSHPNVVTVHEVGEEKGQPFVAMEYVPGKTLGAWLAGQPAVEEILRLFIQAAEGLQAAHDAGVVHRDFKPENVIVGSDGRVRVLDFGLARSPSSPLTDEVADPDDDFEASAPTITRTGVLAGTPAYMSPEQFLGSSVDARADQFAFCVALHEALFGSRPFDGVNLTELAAAVTRGEPTLVTRSRLVDAAEAARIRAVLERGLARDPKDRFDSMAALIHQLRPAAVREGLGVRRLLRWASVASLSAIVVGLVTAGVVAERPTEPKLPAQMVIEPTSAPGPLECEPGTYEDGDRCSPIEWSADLVDCNAEGCTMPRWLAVKMIEDADFRVQQGRPVPMLRDGVPVGFKIYGVRPGNFAQLLGLASGDIVETIDGQDVVTLGDRFAERVRNGTGPDAFTVQVRRKGERLARVIVVQDALGEGATD